MSKVVNVILSGGSGTRLWPLSRTSKPKQFLQLFDKISLFQHTIKRNLDIVDDYLLVTNASQISDAEEQARQVGVKISRKIIEPIGRNTAPAIALAALSLDDDAIMIVTPSDHMIGDENLYKSSMNRAVNLAKDNYLVTFGIKPTEPNVGFGYIEYIGEDVISFREKPDAKTAQKFLKQGSFNWNSGMFCFKASVFLEELKRCNAIMYKTSLKAYETITNSSIDLEAMQNIPADSIDYAVMEKSDRIKTVSTNFYWTDLGSFDAIINYFEEGKQVACLEKINNRSYAFSEKKVFSPIKNIVVIDTEDALVVLERQKTGTIKEIYNKVEEELPNLTK